MGPREWSIGVFGIVRGRRGTILISQRSDGQGWDIPGGGIDRVRDTDLCATLKRELTEETGLCAAGAPRLLGVYPDCAAQDIMVVYVIPRVRGKPVPTDEMREHRFVDFATLRKEIRLVGQEFLGQHKGRRWHILKDAFFSVLPGSRRKSREDNIRTA